MRAQDCIGFQFAHALCKPFARMTRERSLYSIQSPRQFWMIGLFKHHPPNLGSMLDQLHITIGMELSMQR